MEIAVSAIPNPQEGHPEATPFDDGALYDLFFDKFDYGLPFYMDLARNAKGPVLDVACGTGRVLIPMLQAGIDVEGVDLFEPMLARCREKAAALGYSPRLHHSAMASFKLPRRFKLVMIPFNAFAHNLTADAQLGTLRCCLEHLDPGGCLVFDGFFPGAALVTSPEGRRDMEMEIAHPVTGHSVRLYDTRSFNRVEQLMTSHNEIEMLDGDGNVIERHPSKTTLRWIYKNEMELLLRLAGFREWQILGDFDGRPLQHDTDAMIVKAYR